MDSFQDCVSTIMKHARESNVPMVIDGVIHKILLSFKDLSTSSHTGTQEVVELNV